MEEYFVYRSEFYDTLESVARMFGLTVQQILHFNPQLNGRNLLLTRLRKGEEILLPVSIKGTTPFFSMVAAKLRKVTRRKVSSAVANSSYSLNWFPPKPNFGSPSNNLASFLQKIGNPTYKVGSNRNGSMRHRPIIFSGNWAQLKISKVSIPQIKGLPIPVDSGSVPCDGTMSFYKPAHNAVQALFQAWEDAGLISRILTFNGSFVPRTIGSGSKPSNHSFGTAFDINAEWNGEKRQPAGIGKKGCLLELVPIATKQGFYWGGFYNSNIDGMHFEYAFQ